MLTTLGQPPIVDPTLLAVIAVIAVIAVVAIALLFEFTNGFHDAANSVPTIVATRVLRPRCGPRPPRALFSLRQGISSSFPVVRRACRSAWAARASASG